MRDHNIAATLKSGISFGSALAMVISYANWHSVGWAVIHGLMGRLCVGYYIIKYNHPLDTTPAGDFCIKKTAGCAGDSKKRWLCPEKESSFGIMVEVCQPLQKPKKESIPDET